MLFFELAGSIMNSNSNALDAQALEKQLEITINQRLGNFETRVSLSSADAQAPAPTQQGIKCDISFFARFLSQVHCLEVLLFWKEARSPHSYRLRNIQPSHTPRMFCGSYGMIPLHHDLAVLKG